MEKPYNLNTICYCVNLHFVFFSLKSAVFFLHKDLPDPAACAIAYLLIPSQIIHTYRKNSPAKNMTGDSVDKWNFQMKTGGASVLAIFCTPFPGIFH